jgi:hypothetical protein
MQRSMKKKVMCVCESKDEDKFCFLFSHERYTREEYLGFSLMSFFGFYNHRELLYPEQVKITCEYVLILKRKYIIVFGVNLK